MYPVRRAWTWRCSGIAKTKFSPCSTAAPHKGGPLSQGIVHGEHVACPLHNWHSSLGSGCARAPDEGCTPKFAVQVKDGEVYLDSKELAAHAIDLPKPLAGPALKESLAA